ncbi:MAG: hypothetical protein ACI9MR_000397 [Myxococcota bacterium]
MKLPILMLCSAFALAAVSVAGCDSKKEGTPTGDEGTPTSEKTPEAKPVATTGPLAGFDATAELAHLNGKWNVKTRFGQKAPSVWTVENGAVTAVDGEKTTKGELKMDFPGRIKLVVKEKGGESSSHYSYTRNGDTLYLGLGAGGIKIGDVYFGSDSKGFARFDGKACKFHETKMSFGNKPVSFKPAADITCKVEGSKFTYQTPKFGKDAGFEDRTLDIEGTALLSSQLKKNTITKAE